MSNYTGRQPAPVMAPVARMRARLGPTIKRQFRRVIISCLIIAYAHRATAAVSPELTLQLGHRNEITTVALAPDEQTLASASLSNGGSEGEVKLWDMNTGAIKHNLQGPLDQVTTLAFAPNSQVVAVANGAQPFPAVTLYDARTGNLKRVLQGFGSAVSALAFEPDSQTLICACGSSRTSSEISVWNTTTGRRQQVLAGPNAEISGLICAPNQKTLIAHYLLGEGGNTHSEIKFWDTSTWKLRRALAPATPLYGGIALAPNGKLLGGVSGQQVLLWNMADGDLQRTLRGSHVAFSFDSRVIATYDEHAIMLWDAPTGQLLHTFETTQQADKVEFVAFAPDHQTLVAGLGADMRHGIVKWWSVKTGKLRRILRGPSGSVSARALSRDEKTLVTISDEPKNGATLALWHIAGDMAQLKSQPAAIDAAFALCFAPDGARLVSGQEDEGTLRFWDLRQGQLSRTIDAHTGDVIAIAFAADGQRLASGGDDGQLKLWDARTGQLQRVWKAHDPQAIALAPDNSLIASLNGNTSSERTVRIYDLHQGQLRQLITGHGQDVAAALFAADGKTVISASHDATIKFWDVQEGICRATLEGHRGPVLSLALSPDGRLLASGGSDGTIRLWDARTGAMRRVLAEQQGSVLTLCFSAAGTLLSVHNDGTARRWDVATGALRRAQVMASRPVWAATFSRDGKRLAAVDANGAITICDTATGRLLVSLLVLPANAERDIATAWLAYTPDGYYDGSPGCEKYMRWRVANQLFPAAQYAKQFHYPAKVREALK